MDVEIRRHDGLDRYELYVDGQLASFAEAHDDGTRVTMPHTVTAAPFRGRGLAERVVRAALDDARAAGRTVVPTCWFVAGVIDANPEYHALRDRPAAAH